LGWKAHPCENVRDGIRAQGAALDPKIVSGPAEDAPGNHGNLRGPGPGRPKGVPNKVNRDLKEAYLLAANLAGGKEGLVGYLKSRRS
jgi:hypothetical protein